jgi:protein-tyrosine phosphatase
MAQSISQSSVLFVCLGNICRSPLAEGVFRAVAAEKGLQEAFMIDSAGTGGWHVGSGPDPRSTAIAGRYGIDISAQKCRKVSDQDFEAFDYIFGMDESNIDALLQRAPENARQKVHLFMDYALGIRTEIPDPYYGGPDGFEIVYRMIREGSEALASKLYSRTEPRSFSGQASSIT